MPNTKQGPMKNGALQAPSVAPDTSNDEGATMVAPNEKPASEAPKLDRFGFRLGSLKSQAATMYASKKGATLGEVKAALKSTQFNLLTELEGKGHRIERTEAPGKNNRKVTKFRIVTK